MLAQRLVCLRYALFGCYLLAAASGCQFHRTGHGFILQGQPWSLEFNRGCVNDASPDQQASIKPELLPWRSRLKERLAARLSHRGESDIQSPGETVSVPDQVPPLPDAKTLAESNHPGPVLE